MIDESLLREIFARGLVAGLGDKHRTCIEGAIALASGEELTSVPSSVADPDRIYAIILNDAAWSTPAARAKALFPLALAQLDTARTDRGPWVRLVAEGTIRRVLPIALRAAAWRLLDTPHGVALVRAAERCERGGSAADAADAADAAEAARATAATVEAATAARDAADAAARDDADAAGRAAVDAAVEAAYAVGDLDLVLRTAVSVALDAYHERNGQ